MAVVQGTMLYAAELTWNGEVGVEGECRKATNRMGRSTLDVFRSTPLRIVPAESGLTPARALLDHRQAKFTRKLVASSKDGQGPEEILAREISALTTRLGAAASLRPSETVETQDWGSRRSFSGQIIVEERARAL